MKIYLLVSSSRLDLRPTLGGKAATGGLGEKSGFVAGLGKVSMAPMMGTARGTSFHEDGSSRWPDPHPT